MNERVQPRQQDSDSGVAFTVTVLPMQWQFVVKADEAVLDAARRAGVLLPKSCRNGTCRTCLCRALSGSVQYRIEWPGLSAEEKAEGWILPCVARADSDLVIDAPGATRRVV